MCIVSKRLVIMNTNRDIFTCISKKKLFICKMNSCMRKGKLGDGVYRGGLMGNEGCCCVYRGLLMGLCRMTKLLGLKHFC